MNQLFRNCFFMFHLNDMHTGLNPFDLTYPTTCLRGQIEME